jgi:transcriptional regulator with XRE-family HTH domain
MSNLILNDKQNNNIRYRLKALQDALNLTQEEIAKLGGRKRITYAEYIREQNPSQHRYQRQLAVDRPGGYVQRPG